MTEEPSPQRRALFWGLLILIQVAVVAGVSIVYLHWRDGRTGPGLFRRAWAACFTERGLPRPAEPREGYRQERVSVRPQADLRYVESEVHVPGKVDVDANGMQHWRAKAPPRWHILVLGGSVAFGAVASDEAHTWWGLLGQKLEQQGTPCEITVMAAAAWKSTQDVKALQLYGPALHPDVIVLLDGLNDLTQGARADTLHGQWVKPLDGSTWDLLYHEHDWPQRVAGFLHHMETAATTARAMHARLVCVLQPSLLEKQPQSDLERLEERSSASQIRDRDAVVAAYQQMREGLAKLARPGVVVVDASRCFAGEKATTFTDLWHFADPGHELLAQKIVTAAAPDASAR